MLFNIFYVALDSRLESQSHWMGKVIDYESVFIMIYGRYSGFTFRIAWKIFPFIFLLVL